MDMKKLPTCYVCGGPVDTREPHLVNLAIDGSSRTRHNRHDGTCRPTPEYVADALALVASTLGDIMEKVSYTSPLYAAIEAAQDETLQRANEASEYI